MSITDKYINYKGKELFLNLNKSSEGVYKLEFCSDLEEMIVLSIGQIGYVKIIYNNNLIYLGDSSRHTSFLKFIVPSIIGINKICVELQSQTIPKDGVQVKFESLSKQLTSFFSHDYRKLFNELYISESKLSPNGFVIFPANTVQEKREISIVVRDLRTSYEEALKTGLGETFVIDGFDKAVLEIKATFSTKKEVINKIWYKIIGVNDLLVELKNVYGNEPVYKKLYDLFHKKNYIDFYQSYLFAQLYSSLIYDDSVFNRISFEYYDSELDQNINDYILVKPVNYNIQDSFPIIITVATDYSSYEQGFFLSRATESPFDNVFFALINIKGVTLGSYIGEAFFLEEIKEITSKYNICPDKIMLNGYSNGAYAVWSLSERYPYLVNSFSVLSGNAPIDYLSNIEHIPFLAIGSKKDYEYFSGHYSIEQCITQKNAFTEFITLENVTHSAFYWYYLSLSVVNWLLKEKKQSSRIRFKTKTNINANTPYYTILKTKISNSCAHVNIDFKGEEITFWVNNVRLIKIKVELLTQYKKILIYGENGCFYFDVPNKDFYIAIIEDDIKLFFDTKVIDQEPFETKLLDVYYKPVTVLVDESMPSLERIAQNFSAPFSSGWNEKISVKYPIFGCKMLDEIENSSNIIYIITDSKDPNLQKYAEKEKIYLNEKDVEINNISFAGDYIIAFISSNENKSNLMFVYSNNISLFSKSVFTRHIILPSNINNESYAFNTKGFIFTGGSYYYF